MSELLNGVQRIARERERQIVEEKMSLETDSYLDKEELALLACHYALPLSYESPALNLWPEKFDKSWDKKSTVNRIRDLEKAGALIAAEIDRLQLNNVALENLMKESGLRCSCPDPIRYKPTPSYFEFCTVCGRQVPEEE